MKLIKQSVKYLEQQYDLDSILKHIELCGRVSYKSEDKITQDSAKKFVDDRIKSGHLSVLEHGTVYLKFSYSSPTFDPNYISHTSLSHRYLTNSYSKVNVVDRHHSDTEVYITTNYRVLIENDWLDDLKYLCKPTPYHPKRYTFDIVTNRGISHELVRHRKFSFTQESSRFCNYSKDKFGNELTFIYPSWFNKYFTDNYSDKNCLDWQAGLDSVDSETIWLYDMLFSEKVYLSRLRQGEQPQQARGSLPIDIKTEVIMTGFADDWWGESILLDDGTEVKQGFLTQRLAKNAHPQMQEVAKMIGEILEELDNG